MSRQQQQADASDFRQIGAVLTDELVEDLNREHEREVNALYQEQMEIREELTRIVELMQSEILPREKKMHDMIEKIQDVYEQATKKMHEDMTKSLKQGGLSDAQQQQKNALHDPLREMEEELARIAKLLSHGEVRPDIAGWKPQAPQAKTRAAPPPQRQQSPPRQAASPRQVPRQVPQPSSGTQRSTTPPRRQESPPSAQRSTRRV